MFGDFWQEQQTRSKKVVAILLGNAAILNREVIENLQCVYTMEMFIRHKNSIFLEWDCRLSRDAAIEDNSKDLK